jgi:hypothetical protein
MTTVTSDDGKISNVENDFICKPLMSVQLHVFYPLLIKSSGASQLQGMACLAGEQHICSSDFSGQEN